MKTFLLAIVSTGVITFLPNFSNAEGDKCSDIKNYCESGYWTWAGTFQLGNVIPQSYDCEFNCEINNWPDWGGTCFCGNGGY